MILSEEPSVRIANLGIALIGSELFGPGLIGEEDDLEDPIAEFMAGLTPSIPFSSRSSGRSSLIRFHSSGTSPIERFHHTAGSLLIHSFTTF
jgi:hypothetical protein